MRRNWTAFWLTLLLSGCGSEQAPAPEPPAGARATSGDEAHPALGLPNEQHPTKGLITGGPPDPQALRQAASQGVDLVVSLQTAQEPGALEEENQVQTLGMEFVRIPVPGAEGVTRENAARLHEVLEQNPQARVLLHCGSGNRVGALLAMRAFLFEGKTLEEALRLGREAGLRTLEPVVRERLKEACDQAPDRC